MKSPTRKIAGASLLLMGAGFAGLLPFQSYPAGRLLAGAFEAGLIGGLADWFAVTALFRHPLGIPIPHTALLPRNRPKMTEALVSMVEHNLLNQESIGNKLKELQPAEWLLDLMDKELRASAADSRAVRLLQRFMSTPLDGVWSAVQAPIHLYVRKLDWFAVIVSLTGRGGLTEKTASRFLDYVLDRAEEWIVTPAARQQLGNMAVRMIQGIQMKGFLQIAVNTLLGYWDEERIGGMIQQAVLAKLHELRMEDHPDRQAVLTMIRKEYGKLAEHPDTRDKVNEIIAELLGEWVQGDKPLTALRGLQESLLSRLQDDSFTDGTLLPLLRSGLDKLRDRQEWLQAVNTFLQQATARLLEANHSRIGQLVRENVDKMDDDTLIRLVEDKAGKDLQWIRVNGAVCGFLLGLALTAVRIIVE